ncbi:MAG: sporulation integral membrane protein YtvI [Clostridia bacterium]|nr:sporulation integral membrane protein YtvI [Clostridia bacterium]
MDREQKKDTVINVLYYGFVSVAVIAAGYLGFKYLLPVISPFAVAFLVAALLNPLMLFLEKRARIPRKIGGFLLVALAVAAVFAIIFLILQRGVEEIGRLADTLSSLKWEDFVPMRERINALLLHLPGMDGGADLEAFWKNAELKVTGVLERSVPNLESGISMLTGLFTGLFDVVLSFFVTVIACYYMTVDRAKISGAVYSLFPERISEWLKKLKNSLMSTVGKYLKAYGLIVLITFTELFVAFTVLRVDYALLLAAVIALIDILPVLGTGIVLVPWALFALFVRGKLYLGVGLLVSYGIITFVRQIIEPKIVGSYIGMHPLATLIAMFAGLKLFGVAGMLLLPVVLMGIRNLEPKITIAKTKPQ